MVSAVDVDRAREALAAYDEEEGQKPLVPERPPAPGAAWTGGVAAALLVVFFFGVTGPRDRGTPWFARGSASADRILAGEAWRTVTALTLHADPVHVLGNAAAWGVLVTAVGRQLGPGVALGLVLLVGAAGNGLTALVRGQGHVSVGASTSIFGAVGILGALRVRARRRPGAHRGWVVVAASLVLVGLLGTGGRADVLAHLFGLLAGGAMGVGAVLVPRPTGAAGQWGLALVAAAVLVGAWWLALASSPPR